MNIWKILGIDPTKDKNEIKKAYRRKLAKTNPEDDPEGFKTLRAAFEVANKYADREDNLLEEAATTETANDTPEVRFLNELNAIYKDFYRRIDINSWQELLNCEYCISLDTSEKAFDQLMKFLMDYFKIPGKIFKLIVDMYYIKDNTKELTERYPADFLEFMINNAEYNDLIDYSDFLGDKDADYDAYIEQCYKLDSAVRNKDIKTQDIVIEELVDSDIYNPYFDIMRVRNFLQKDDNDSAKNLIDSLAEKYPENIKILICKGDVYTFFKDNDMVRKCYERAIEIEPDDFVANAKLAELELEQSNFEKARDIFIELMKKSHYDNAIRVGIIRSNEGLIKLRLKELENKDLTEVEINKIKMELGWSYYQSYKFKEAVEILDSFEPNEENIFEYNNVKGRSLLCVEDYKRALECFVNWKQKIEDIPKEDLSEEANKKKVRIQYVKFLIGSCYLKLEEFEKAKQYIDEAISIEHDEILLAYEAKCEVEYKSKNYKTCLDYTEILEKRDKRNYVASDYRARALYKMRMYQEAYYACEKTLGIYPYIIDPYELEMKIFMDMEDYDSVKRVIDRYGKLGIESDTCRMYEAKILADKSKEYDKACEILEKILPHIDDDEQSDINKRDDFFVFLGECHEKLKNIGKAETYYKRAISVNKKNEKAHGYLGLIYENLNRNEEAIKEYSSQLSICKSAYFYLHRGVLYKRADEVYKAKDDYEEAILLNKGQNAVPYKFAAAVYVQLKDFDTALDYYNKAIALSDIEDERIAIKLQMARIYRVENKLSDAGKIFTEILKTNKTNPYILIDYSYLLQRINKTAEAEKLLQKALINEDARVDIFVRLFNMAYATGDASKIEELYKMAKAKDALCSSIYATMGDLYFKFKNYNKAEKMYLLAVSLDKNKEHNYYSELAETARKQLGGKKRAKEYIDKLNKRVGTPRTPEDFVALARIKRIEKNYQEAITLLNKAMKLPLCQGCVVRTCDDAYEQLAIVFECLKMYDKAIEIYKEIASMQGVTYWIKESIKRLTK